MPNDFEKRIERNVSLAPFTTIKLGGPAQYFINCQTVEDIIDSLEYAKNNNLRTHILGGGSNTIFTGKTFEGLVIKINLKGIEFNNTNSSIIVTVQAGEPWDPFVQSCLEKGLAGLECLSGIPGSVGATPMQNVGAYGQSVSDCILEVKALDKETRKTVKFTNEECLFDYRSSRFKYQDKDKYIITEVSYKLTPEGAPTIKYPELLATIQKDIGKLDIGHGKDALMAVREAVIKLRKKKSMIIDPTDPNSQSCGSFFVSPIVTKEEFLKIEKEWTANHDDQVPHFPEGPHHFKLPAGWLIEKSGITKGYRQGSVGISENHALALVNYGDDPKQLLDLAEYVKNKVKKKFKIELQSEPILIN